jgi:hypothetical protein
MLLNQCVHRVLFDGFILTLSLKKSDFELLILMLLRECEELIVAAGKLLLKLSFNKTFFLDTFHRDIKSMVVTLEFSWARLPHPLLLSKEFRVVGVYYTSSLLQIDKLSLGLDLGSLYELLLGLLL